MRSIDKINRQVHYLSAPAFDNEDSSGVNNNWVYDRPPEGYLFELIAVDFSTTLDDNRFAGIANLIDGHEYTHWNLYPGVECREMLARVEFNEYTITDRIPLYGWECKEYTLAIRSTSAINAVKMVVVVWYTLKKASRMELLYYAIKHPSRHDTFRRALAGTTVEPEEQEDEE